jgi:hypothetical protein
LSWLMSFITGVHAGSIANSSQKTKVRTVASSLSTEAH